MRNRTSRSALLRRLWSAISCRWMLAELPLKRRMSRICTCCTCAATSAPACCQHCLPGVRVLCLAGTEDDGRMLHTLEYCTLKARGGGMPKLKV